MATTTKIQAHFRSGTVVTDTNLWLRPENCLIWCNELHNYISALLILAS